jgi:hypothetical protein
MDRFSKSIDKNLKRRVRPTLALFAYHGFTKTIQERFLPSLCCLLLHHSLETRGRCHRSCSLFHFLESHILNNTAQSAVREGTGEELACIRVVVVEVHLV